MRLRPVVLPLARSCVWLAAFAVTGGASPGNAETPAPASAIGASAPGSNLGERGSPIVFERRRWRRPEPQLRTVPEAYMVFKVGGLHVTEEPGAEGVFVGMEAGGTIQDVIDLGINLDYFHRGTHQSVLLNETDANGLPLRVRATLEESAAHLVPIGVSVRLRMPVGTPRVVPFVSGTLSYEALFLENGGSLDPADPLYGVLEDEETFQGLGVQLAAGVNLGVGSNVGLFGEIGMHRGSPKQEILLNGEPVDLEVDLDGAFLRAGLRVTM